MGINPFVRSLLLKVLAWFPSPLPRTPEEFDSFAESILQIYSLPDTTSFRHAIAVMIQHLGPLEHKKSKRFFAHSILKAMSNETAFQKIQEFKEIERNRKQPLVIDAEDAQKSSSGSH